MFYLVILCILGKVVTKIIPKSRLNTFSSLNTFSPLWFLVFTSIIHLFQFNFFSNMVQIYVTCGVWRSSVTNEWSFVIDEEKRARLLTLESDTTLDELKIMVLEDYGLEQLIPTIYGAQFSTLGYGEYLMFSPDCYHNRSPIEELRLLCREEFINTFVCNICSSKS